MADERKHRDKFHASQLRRLQLHIPRTQPRARTGLSRSRVVVLALAYLVHGLPASHVALAQTGANAPDLPSASTTLATRIAALPPNTREIREAILDAAHTGAIEELKVVLEWNELPPELADKPVADPIAHLKAVSGDGEGREILAILINILELDYAKLRQGKDAENNAIYVWPYLAELPIDKLTPAQEVDLYRLVPPAVAKEMRAKKKWTWYRLAIGADGTWHSFEKRD